MPGSAHLGSMTQAQAQQHFLMIKKMPFMSQTQLGFAPVQDSSSGQLGQPMMGGQAPQTSDGAS